ncbi:radical SAM protein [candidate division KSB1 bacterium]|nr:MAG: radical SAM protein [candidate division KSB1 bacterium]RLF70146.1 MAG: radical SAM protein [Thermoplasmata archaeon]RLF72597.1 MAG: radical SAM protein [Thermoplasmata archaeon]
MAIYKITYSERFKRANLYNYGCNFNCAWCSYKLKSNVKPDKFLSIDRIKEVLSSLDLERIHFIGGEPTTYPGLAEIAEFAHNQLGVYTKIGHSNGSCMPPENIDAWCVSIRTVSDKLHRKYTGGKSVLPVLQNFKKAYNRGIEIDASSILIPNLFGHDEIEKVAQFIAEINPNIPYHIIGYVPVPNSPWRRPTYNEVKEAENIARKHLKHVTSSCLSVEDYSNLHTRDIRYKSVRVA